MNNASTCITIAGLVFLCSLSTGALLSQSLGAENQTAGNWNLTSNQTAGTGNLTSNQTAGGANATANATDGDIIGAGRRK